MKPIDVLRQMRQVSQNGERRFGISSRCIQRSDPFGRSFSVSAQRAYPKEVHRSPTSPESSYKATRHFAPLRLPGAHVLVAQAYP